MLNAAIVNLLTYLLGYLLKNDTSKRCINFSFSLMQVLLTQSVYDRQTDGQTDRQTDKHSAVNSIFSVFHVLLYRTPMMLACYNDSL